ncbi:LemA family protein [Chitinophaga caeni]|uniref:LemA family protein n=1 Tax=Chitinophaga caeni TaxID=2029983 RepID=A0A291QTI2_9BACT|nr:LemA family protein [Chitinophaga caeni]ATL47221.1 LemA family protein [Chitinophaga caeni]
MKGGIIALVILVLLGFYSCSKYNSLVKLDENVKNKWGLVEAQYQRRADLIDNLVATVKGAANFEQSTLTQVVEARANATKVQINADDLTPEKIAQFQQAQGALSQSLGRLLAVAESYPTLQSVQNFRDLQAQIEGTENRIATVRSDFNNSVRDYNRAVRVFPTNIIAGMFGLKEKGYFASDPGAEKAPKVDFGN